MSVYSMTGYAAGQNTPDASASSPGARPASSAWLGLEIRSVNGRFLDLSFRLPEEIRQLEPALREQLASRLRRGKVEVRATIETGGAAGQVTEPSARLLQRLAMVQDQARTWLPGVAPLSVADLLRLAASEQAGTRDWSDELMPLCERVLMDLLAARAREGARLATVLLQCISDLRALVKQAVPLVPQLVAAQRQRFLERFNEALAGAQQAPSTSEAAQDRALTEAASFAIRIDVAEELARLGAHLDEIERLIKKGGEIGKRLDFLIQELHREANTLGSKSAALEMTHIAVDMKVLVEQMREQVQNIE